METITAHFTSFDRACSAVRALQDRGIPKHRCMIVPCTGQEVVLSLDLRSGLQALEQTLQEQGGSRITFTTHRARLRTGGHH